jgi:hypothetical protein
MNATACHADAVASFPGTRRDFLGALRSLGATIEPGDAVFPAHDPLRVSLRCPASRWVHVFGPVQILAVQFGPGGHPAFQAWQYQCADGPILCIGCQYEHLSDDNWIIVRAVSLC